MKMMGLVPVVSLVKLIVSMAVVNKLKMTVKWLWSVCKNDCFDGFAECGKNDGLSECKPNG